MNALSVCMVSPYRSGGRVHPFDTGIHWYTERLVRAIVQTGCNVTIVAPHDACADDAAAAAVPFTIVPTYRKGLAAPLQIARRVARLQPDVVHVQHELFAYGGVLTALLLPIALRQMKRRGTHVVVTIHGVIPLASIDTDFVRRNGLRAPIAVVSRLWRYLLRATCAAADVVHVHEEQHRRLLQTQYAVRAPIEVVPLGIDEDVEPVERSTARKALGIGAEEEVVLFFGYLAAYKGIPELLSAWKMLSTTRPQVRLLLAGAVPRRLQHVFDLEREIALRGLDSSSVLRLGFVPDADVPNVFSSADVMILPYSHALAASGPMSIAAAYRIPVLISEPFRVEYPHAGTLFEVTPAAIALAVERFFCDPADRAGRRSFSASLLKDRSWIAVARRLTAMYAALVPRKE